MTGQESDTRIVDPSKEVEVVDVNAMREEMFKLRQQMAEMHQAWVKGQPAPVYPANPVYVPPLAQSREPPTVNSAPAFPFYQQSYSTTSYPPQAPPPKQNPPPKKFYPSQKCAYCSGALGHDIEKCWNLKNAIQKLIDAGDIVVQSQDSANTGQSLSPVHNETHMVGVIDHENELAEETQKQFAQNNVIRTCDNSSNLGVKFSG